MHSESTTPRRSRSVRVNLLHSHGSPTSYLYSKEGCRCAACKAAQAEWQAAYRATNREEIAAQRAVWYAAHRTKNRARRAAYYTQHRAEIAVKDAAYRAAHREKNRAYYVAYNSAHREGRAAYNTAYRDAHREELAAYRATHRGEDAARRRQRRARKRGNGGTHTAEDVRAQHARQKGRCYWCKAKVGSAYHADHVVPLSRGGSNGSENIVVSCPWCNLSKNSEHPMDWAGVMF